jgi:hypothetical protein
VSRVFVLLPTDAAAVQQASVNNAANLLLQQQAGAMFGLPGAGLLNPASLLLANQLQQAGAAQLQQTGGTTHDQQISQQQLATFLQQQLWAMGLTAAAHPLLAQGLALSLPQNSTTADPSNPNSVSLLSTASAQQGLLNPASLFAAQRVSNAPSAATVSNNGTSLSNNGSSSDSAHHSASVHAFLNNARSLGLHAAQQDEDEQEERGGLTGRPPVVLYITCDDDSLSEYQCLVRKQIELFEAGREDAESNAQGRNRPIVIGQVGIRCRHCTMLPPKHRARGAIYYPAKLHGIYQASQNMASAHLGEHCQHVPAPLRSDLLRLRDRKSSAGGGKKYWADGVRVLGVFEDEDGLRFEKR